MLAKLHNFPDHPLVCWLSSNGTAQKKAISYSRVREIFRQTLGSFISNPHLYGTHSLGKGGATASKLNGIPDSMLDKHAGWKCAKSKDRYISFTLDGKLSVLRANKLQF